MLMCYYVLHASDYFLFLKFRYKSYPFSSNTKVNVPGKSVCCFQVVVAEDVPCALVFEKLALLLR